MQEERVPEATPEEMPQDSQEEEALPPTATTEENMEEIAEDTQEVEESAKNACSPTTFYSRPIWFRFRWGRGRITGSVSECC